MLKVSLLILLLILHTLDGQAQIRNMHYSAASQINIMSIERLPFWMYTNQHGSIPLPGASASFLGNISRDYSTTTTRLVDWGFSFEGRANLGSKAELFLIEGYAKGKLGIFEAKAGREKEMVGLVDTTLSSGSFAVSGNALGIPKIEFAIPEFYSLPMLGKMFAIKGNVVNGLVGKVPIRYPDAPEHAGTYFHQKSFFGRVGQPGSKLKLYGGINHVVYWGNDEAIFGEDLTISPSKTYYYMFMGKKVLDSWSISKIGNHLGSIDLGFDYNFDKLRLFVYRQNFYEKGAIRYLANIRDGLNGISLTNQQPVTHQFQWRKLLLEVLFTKNQAGESWSKWTPSGPEFYYNHKVYAAGYSYKGMGVGTPFITPKHLAKKGLPSHPSDYFINNRVLLFHAGIESSYKKWSFTTKISYSRNYGSYETSAVDSFWLNGPKVPHVPRFGIFQEVGQLSTYFEGEKEFNNGLSISYIAAFDIGRLYDNAVGGMVTVTKTFKPDQNKSLTRPQRRRKWNLINQ